MDFGKLIREQTVDKHGHVLPADLTTGAYRIRDLADSATGGVYEGKVTVDKTYGHAAYGCTLCCGPITPFMEFNPLDVAVGNVSNQGVIAGDSCNGQQLDVTSDFLTWWTDNTSIATANGNQIKGVALGTTNNRATSKSMYWGRPAYAHICPGSTPSATGGTNVSCAVPTNYRQTSGTGDNSTGVINFQYEWNSSTGNLADLSACTIKEVVTYPGGNPFTWPSPPFAANQTSPNPTSPTPVPGKNGIAYDSHGHPNFQTPYQATSFTATQYYQYVCPCTNGGQPVNLMGPLYIFRSVQTSSGTWTYTVTKSGVSATETLP